MARPSNRDTIITQAGALFAAKGYDGVSMREVAQACNLSKSAIYHHFGSKEALYLSVIQTMAGHIQSVLHNAAQEGTWEERLESQVQAIAQLIAASGVNLISLIRDLSRFIPDDSDSWREQIGGAVFSPIVKAIQEGIDAGELVANDPVCSAWMLVAMTSIAARPLLGEPDPDLVAKAIDIFLNGVRVRRET